MGERYSDIRRAAALKKALDNYLLYLSAETDRQANIGQGNPKPDTVDLYILPFAQSLATKQYAQVSGTKSHWESHKAKYTGYTLDSLDTGGGDSAINLKGYRAARVNHITGRSANGTVKTSNVTKMKYLSYGGSSTSAPFGNKTTSVTEKAAFDVIAAKFPANSATLRTYWSREKY